MAEFETLPEPEKGQITGGGYVWISNLCSLASLIPGVCGGGLIYAAYRFVDAGGNEAAGITLGLFGALGIVTTCVLGLYYNTIPENIYQRAKIRRILGVRETALVGVDDPEAIPIAITLRENWTKIKLVQESDCGLMLIDERETELRFEGDHERFRLPGAAILTCEPELFFHPIDKRTEFWLIRLVARTSQGMREVLLLEPHLDWRLATNRRRRANAAELATRIAALGNLVVTVELAEAEAG